MIAAPPPVTGAVMARTRPARRALVVEPVASIRRVLHYLLEMLGFDVCVATQPDEAFAIAEAEQDFQIVITEFAAAGNRRPHAGGFCAPAHARSAGSVFVRRTCPTRHRSPGRSGAGEAILAGATVRNGGAAPRGAPLRKESPKEAPELQLIPCLWAIYSCRLRRSQPPVPAPFFGKFAGGAGERCPRSA